MSDVNLNRAGIGGIKAVSVEVTWAPSTKEKPSRVAPLLLASHFFIYLFIYFFFYFFWLCWVFGSCEGFL